MSNDIVVWLAAPALVPDPLTELLRSGARRLVEAAVRAEFEEHLSAFGHEKLPDGRQRVVRNGRLPERKILTGLGEVDVRVPKARSRSGSPEPFRSSVAPPCVRRCASLDAAIPWLYLHGVSTGQMRQAVVALVGEEAARGLSANVVSRLKRSWDEEYQQWRRGRLEDEWVYLWADGLYSGLRGEGERLCVLVVIGVNTRGEKLELPRFRGPLTLWGGGIHHAEIETAVPAGLPAPDGLRVALARTGRTPERLARELEPSVRTIRNRVAQADRDAGRHADGWSTAEREEICRLRRENRRLREERAMLASATAWSAARARHLQACPRASGGSGIYLTRTTTTDDLAGHDLLA